MQNQVQSGTMMVRQSAIPQSLGVESEPYCQNWRSLGVVESLSFEQKARAAGWNLFFMAGELRTVGPAWGAEYTLRRGVRRLLAKTRLSHCNCLELTHIPRKPFLGISSLSRAAHPRHIQQGFQMQSLEQRA